MESKKTNKNNISIFYINIRSLRKHYDELLCHLEIQRFCYDVIVLSETWITESEASRYEIQGYNLILQPRATGNSGGVAIYIRNYITYSKELFCSSVIEIVKLDVKLLTNSGMTTISIVGIYRACKSAFDTVENDLYNLLNNLKKDAILIGDMNLDILQNNSETNKYLSCMASMGFEVCNEQPTRVTSTSATCIDHVLIRNHSKLQHYTMLQVIDITDHYAITVTIEGKLQHSDENKYQKYIDYYKLNKTLRSQDWKSVINCETADASMSQFYTIYNHCIDKVSYIKQIKRQKKPRNPWATNSLINKINIKNTIYKRFKNDRNNKSLHDQYVNISKEVTSLIRKTKKEYYTTQLKEAKGNSKQYWDIINNISKKQQTNVSTNNNAEKTNVEAADAYNAHFTNIASKLLAEEFGHDFPTQLDNIKRIEREFKFRKISYNDILIAINRMKNKRSCGFDGISIKTIKNNIDVFIPILYHIYNLSLDTGEFPESLKIACVIPIYKAGNQSDLNNYRPISLLTTISKIFEKCIHEQISTYFLTNNLFSSNQFGFLPKRGTDLAVINHIDNIVSSLDQGKCCLGLYIDFKKAFDLVDLTILTQKLEIYGVRGIEIEWFKSFLFNRNQIVKIKSAASKINKITHGIPQGGVLGPFLFLVYINDLLQKDFYSTIYAYADDTSLICSANNYESLKFRIEADLNQLSKWLFNNKLIINREKTKGILFSYRPHTTDRYKEDLLLLKCHSYKCKHGCVCNYIEITDNVKYLGLYIDSGLRWRTHVENLWKKLLKINYNIYFIRQFIDYKDLLTLYHSWFQSAMSYGIIHWGGTYSNILEPISIAQRMALRTICNLRKFDSVSNKFQEHNVLTLEGLYSYHLLTFLKQNIQLFEIYSTKRTLRSSNRMQLTVPPYNKEMSRRQAFFKSIMLYNNNTAQLNITASVGQYKKTCKDLILSGNILLL